MFTPHCKVFHWFHKLSLKQQSFTATGIHGCLIFITLKIFMLQVKRLKRPLHIIINAIIYNEPHLTLGPMYSGKTTKMIKDYILEK